MPSPFRCWINAPVSFGTFAGHTFRTVQHIRKTDAVVRVGVDHVDPAKKTPLHQILYTIFMDEPPNGEDVVFQAAFETDLLVGEILEKRCHQGGPQAAQPGARAHQRDGVHRLEAHILRHTFRGYRLHCEMKRDRLAVSDPQTLHGTGEAPGDPADAHGRGKSFQVNPAYVHVGADFPARAEG